MPDQGLSGNMSYTIGCAAKLKRREVSTGVTQNTSMFKEDYLSPFAGKSAIWSAE